MTERHETLFLIDVTTDEGRNITGRAYQPSRITNRLPG